MKQSRLPFRLRTGLMAMAFFAATALLPAAEPVPVCVTKAEYHAVPRDGHVQIVATLDVRQSVAGTHALPLDLGTMSLEAATVDGRPAPLLRNPLGWLALLGTEKGTSTLRLTMSAPLHRIGSDRLAVLHPVSNAAATLAVQVPAGQTLLVNGRATLRPKPLSEAASITLPIGNRERIALRFTNGKSANGLDSVVLAESRASLALAGGLADWNCETSFLVTGEPRREIESTVSGQMQVTDVTGADVEGWIARAAGSDASRSIVRIRFRRPFTGTRTVRYAGRTALPSEPFWQVPNMVISGVNAHAGHLSIAFPSHQAIRVDEFAGLRQSAGFPEGSRSGIVPVSFKRSLRLAVPKSRVLEFDYWKEDFELNLVLPRRKSTSAAHAVSVFDVRRKRVELTFTATWDAPAAQRTASVTLPAEWSIRAVRCDGRPAHWKTLPIEAAVQHLRVSVPVGPDGPSGPPAARGERVRPLRLVITAVRDLEYPETAHAAAVWKVPAIRLPGVRLIHGQVILRSPPDVSVTVRDEKNLIPVPASHEGGGHAYRYLLHSTVGDGYSATVAVRPRQRGYSVESLTVARLERRVVRTWSELRVTPEAGGFRSLKMRLPKDAVLQSGLRWLGTDAKLIGDDRDPASTDGTLRILRFDRTVRQPGRLLIEFTIPRSQGSVTFDAPQLPDADRTNGYVLILAGPRRHVQVTANYTLPEQAGSRPKGTGPQRRPLPLAEVSPRDVLQKFAGPQEGVAVRFVQSNAKALAAFRFVVPKVQIALTQFALPDAGNPVLVCRRQRLQTVVDASGALHHHLELLLEGAGACDLRVTLPQGADLWGAAGSSGPVEVRRDHSALVVPVSFIGTEPRRTRIRLLYHQPAESSGGNGRLHLVPPAIALAANGGTNLPIDVQRSEWTLHHPSDRQVTSASGQFRTLEPLDEPGWLKRLGAWSVAHRLRLLVLLLAVPFAWVAVRFLLSLRFPNRLPYRYVGVLCAIVAVVAISLARVPRQAAEPSKDSHLPRSPAAGQLNSRLESGKPNAPVTELRAFEVAAPTDRELLGHSQPVSRSTPAIGRTALLSVPVEFVPPGHLAVKRFEYLGSSDSPPTLTVGYQSRGSGLLLRLCVMLGVLTACGMLRRRSRRTLLTLAVLGLMVPLTVAGWAAEPVQPFIDGVFFGTLTCLAIWMLCAAAPVFWSQGRWSLSRFRFRPARRTVAGLVVSSSLLAGGANVLAADAAPASPKGFVSAANYELSVTVTGEKPSVSVAARFDLTSLSSEPIAIALPLGRVAVTAATLDGSPAVVNWRKAASATNADWAPEVRVAGPGRRLLKMMFLLPCRTEGEDTLFVLPSRPALSGRAVFKLPSAKHHVQLSGLAGSSRRSIHNGVATVEFPVDRVRDISVRLRRGEFPPPTADVRVDSIASRIDIKDSGLFQRDEVSLRVRNGKLTNWTFQVPSDARIIGISGPDVAGWELSPRAAKRSVRIDFRKSIRGTTKVAFELFHSELFSAEPRTIALPQIAVGAASAESRHMSVFAGNEFIVRGVKPEGFTSESPFPRLANGLRGNCRLKNAEVATLEVSRRTPQTAVTAEHAVMLEPETVRVASRLTFDFQGSPRTKLSVMLPEGYTLHSLRGSHKAEWSQGGDDSTVAVVFPRTQSGTVRVSLDGSFRRKPSATNHQLSFPGPMAPQRLTVTAGVWSLDGMHARLKSTDGWTQLTASQSPAAILARCSRPPLGVVQTSSLEPGPISLETPPSASRITARSLTLVRATDTAVHYTFLMRWSGLASARPTVAFALPAWMGRKLDLSRNRSLRCERRHDPAGEDERTQWTVTGFEAGAGEITVVATAILPPPLDSGNRVAAPKLQLLQPARNEAGVEGRSAEFAPVPRPQSFVVFCNESSDRLERLPTPKFPPFQAADLPPQLRIPGRLRSRIALAADRLRTDDAATEPVWSLKPVIGSDPDKAVVSRAELTTLLERDGSWRMQADYRVRHSGRPYLAVKIPDGARLASASVAGRPVHCGKYEVKRSPVHLVPLQRVAGSRFLMVRLVISGRLPDDSFRASGSRNWFDGAVRVSLPAPHVVTPTEDPKLGAYVLETVWTVHLADGLRAIPKNGIREANLVATRPDRRTTAFPAPLHAPGNKKPDSHRHPSGPVDAGELVELNRSRAAESVPVRFEFPLDDSAGIPAVIRERHPATPPWAASLGDPMDSEIAANGPSTAPLHPPAFDLPESRQTLTFYKAGGAPQLSLDIRTREGTQLRRRLLWSLVWGVFGVVALIVVRRIPRRTAVSKSAASRSLS